MSTTDIMALAAESIELWGESLTFIKAEDFSVASLKLDLAIVKMDKALALKAKHPAFEHMFEKDDEFRTNIERIGLMVQVIGETLKVFPPPGTCGESLYNKLLSFFKKLCDYYDESCRLSSIFDPS